MFRSIWSKSLRDFRVPILGWGPLVGLLMAVDFAESTPAVVAAFASLAPGYRFLGDPYAIGTPEGFITFRLLEAIVPIALCVWPILTGARLVRGEEERGTLDVLLATPQPRVRLLLEKIGALVIALLLIAVLFALGTVVGEASIGHIDVGRALLAGLNLILLAFCFSMVALLISQFTISRGVAAGWTSGLLLLSFLLDSIGRVVNGSWVQYLSPFYYYNLNRPLVPGFQGSPAAVLLLVGLSALCAAISLLLFTRRDSGSSAFSLQLPHPTGNNLVERSLRQAERDVSVRAIGLRTLSAQGWSAFWWLLALVSVCLGYVVLLLPNALELFRQALQKTPTLAKLFNGSDTSTNGGFVGTFVFAFLPAVVAIFALTLAMTWATDLENGRLELVLDTPRSRPRVMLERFGAICLLALLAPILTWLAILVGTRIDNFNIDQGHVLSASFSMLPPALIIMGLVYSLAGRLRYSAVLGILSAYISLAFLTAFLKGVIQLPDWVMSLSIFYQYGNPMTAGMNWAAFLGMMGFAVVLLVIGLVQFRYADVERG
jgi:ABC-2 type transport system permease protein